MNTDLKEYYKKNDNFKEYVDKFRRIHPELTVDDILEKIIVLNVADFYKERDRE